MVYVAKWGILREAYISLLHLPDEWLYNKTNHRFIYEVGDSKPSFLTTITSKCGRISYIVFMFFCSKMETFVKKEKPKFDDERHDRREWHF